MFDLFGLSECSLDCYKYITMIDKGKYASHGAFIKRIPLAALAQRQKAKLGCISLI
jgi:hypothetical protein